MTLQPLQTVLHSQSQSGRLAKWAIELGEYDIEYKPRTSSEAQVLADFIIELVPSKTDTDDKTRKWKLHVDGASPKQGSGVRIQLESPTGEVIEQSFCLGFNASNNEADYESLIAGLRLVQSIGARKISAFSDSQLVTSQFHGEYEAKNERMEAYLARDRGIANGEDDLPLVEEIVTRSKSKGHIQESEEELLEAPQNQRTSGESSRRTRSGVARTAPARSVPEEIHVHEVNNESQKPFQDELESRPDWRTLIFNYIETGELPPERWEARNLKARRSRYCIMEGKIFKRTFSEPYLLCASPKEASIILKKTHDRSCVFLAIKIKKHGYFSPTIISDSEQFAARCDRCQQHAPMLHQPTQKLSIIYSPYPFMKWSMDIVGPFVSSGPAQLRFLWKNIVCRHGLPYEIITDNGSQFISKVIKDFCDKWKIKLKFAGPRYPKCNGQAEATNITIVNNLKKRLDLKKSKWSEELNGVLWECRTTPHTATQETLFSLSYGIEAVIPPEIEVSSQRRGICPDNVEINKEMLLEYLDMIEERRERATVRIQNYQQAAARYYDSNVRGRSFSIDDLVLRKVFDGPKENGAGKLGTRWEGLKFAVASTN
ncbi:uncharacterized protein LOC130498085 [Raphanus sativus]|uniref:Uncharacterized protein LOC130498085 n=1 Tax=Raphanus sativus TaxID=3726 RepID=A0A9W3C7A7_RAPSA|nr:uncharacterized protein LOC130498085 [Raphanus sativus]